MWLYPGKAGWHFITIPVTTAKEIDYYFSHTKKGWGSLPVQVIVGKTSWKTSIFPDKKSDSYVLPIKMAVRRTESIKAGDLIHISLEIES